MLSILEAPAPMSSVDEDYITLTQAAVLAGYRSTSTLQAAARSGRLKTMRVGPRVQVTTRAWLDEYLSGLHAGKGRRGGLRSGDGAPEG